MYPTIYFEQPLSAPDLLTVEVIGEGIIAEMYNGIISVFAPLTKGYNVDPVPCLPNPEIPNFQVYCEIGESAIILHKYAHFLSAIAM